MQVDDLIAAVWSPGTAWRACGSHERVRTTPRELGATIVEGVEVSAIA